MIKNVRSIKGLNAPDKKPKCCNCGGELPIGSFNSHDGENVYCNKKGCREKEIHEYLVGIIALGAG